MQIQGKSTPGNEWTYCMPPKSEVRWFRIFPQLLGGSSHLANTLDIQTPPEVRYLEPQDVPKKNAVHLSFGIRLDV